MTPQDLALLSHYTLNIFDELSDEKSLELVKQPILPIQITKGSIKKIRADYKEKLREALQHATQCNDSLLNRKINFLKARLGLQDDDVRILQALILYVQTTEMRQICDAAENVVGRQQPFRVLSRLTGLSSVVVSRVLAPMGNLYGRGILYAERYRSLQDVSDYATFSSSFELFLDEKRNDVRAFMKLFLGEAKKPTLKLQDFAHIKTEMDLIARAMSGALSARARGVNILVHGAPGTGKTEFAATLARACRSKLYSTAECSSNGVEAIAGSDRMAQLKAKSALLENTNWRACLLFDEMEDILDHSYGGRRSVGSKVFINRMLENNPVPVIWTSNTLQDFDPAFLRRMTYVLEFKTPRAQVRSRHLHKTAKDAGINLTHRQAEIIAARHDLPPAVFSMAAATARYAGGAVADLEQTLAASARTLTGQVTYRDEKAFPAFAPELITTDIDLTALTGQLKSGKTRQFSMCLYGPSGTGKSAYARHLAKQLDLPVLHKRGSDLISPYVGQTERNIAAAFHQAVEDGAMLIFDEADSFLRSRIQARHSWEVTAVNEMLTWMESHPLPFICTTNLMDAIDEAALRRFVFKLEFGYLTPQQLDQACRKLCGIPMRRFIEHVTPGDIVVAHRRLELLVCAKEPREITLHRLLCEEVSAKHGTPRRIGFEFN